MPPHVITTRPTLTTGWYPQYMQVGSMELEMSAMPDIAMTAVLHASPHPPDPAHTADRAEQEMPVTHTAGLHWTVLPALMAPNLNAMRAQATGGSALVLGVIAACVSATHTAVALGNVEGPLLFLLVGAVWSAAVVALVCLAGLMFGDPGVIARSEERCMPVPDGPIREQLMVGQTLSSDIRNYDDPTHGSYCVRCLIWRRAADKVHHCSTCQRCGMYQCVCIYERYYTNIYTRAYTHVHSHAWIHAHTSNTYTHSHVRSHAHIPSRRHRYTHVLTNAHAHAYSHMHTFTHIFIRDEMRIFLYTYSVHTDRYMNVQIHIRKD